MRRVSPERLRFAKRLRVYLGRCAPRDKDGEIAQPYRYWYEQLSQGLLENLSPSELRSPKRRRRIRE